MKHIFTFLALMMLFTLASCSTGHEKEEESDPIPEPTPESISFSYEQGIYQSANLPYRKAAISATDNKKAALVLYLHGGTSKGNDNTTQMNEVGIDSIGNYLVSHQINSIFLVPQCPSNKSWGGSMNGVLKSLIDEYAASGVIDTKRIYIFGGSMGGTGTWSMISSYPDLFAAAMPVAGKPSGCNASNVARTPVYTVMGTADEIMDITVVEDFINHLNELGGESAFDIENGWTHEITCIKSYTSKRLEWIFKHTRQTE